MIVLLLWPVEGTSVEVAHWLNCAPGMVAPVTFLACLLDWLLPFLGLDDAWELSQGSRLLIGSVLRRSFFSVATWGRGEVALRCRLLVASQFQVGPFVPKVPEGCARDSFAAMPWPVRPHADQVDMDDAPASWIELWRQAWVAFVLRAWLTADAAAR